MVGSTPRLRSPFLVSPYLAHGGTGVLFSVNDKIVVKTVWRFDDTHESLRQQQTDSLVGLQKETEIYDILENPTNWHPNIVLSFLHGPYYLFMERLPRTLYDYISQKLPTTEVTQCRWVYQITNAIAWLEQLSIAHGDLRPPNILLDNSGNIKICDFDNAHKYGQYIKGAHWPYYKLLGQDGFGVAGAASEQFAVGSCTYFIHMGEDPDFASESDNIIDGFPIFGAIVRRCWDRGYRSIMELNLDVATKVKEAKGDILDKDEALRVMEMEESSRGWESAGNICHIVKLTFEMAYSFDFSNQRQRTLHC